MVCPSHTASSCVLKVLGRTLIRMVSEVAHMPESTLSANTWLPVVSGVNVGFRILVLERPVPGDQLNTYPGAPAGFIVGVRIVEVPRQVVISGPRLTVKLGFSILTVSCRKHPLESVTVRVI